MRAAVFSAGQVHDYARIRPYVGTPDLVICADAGVRHALALGLTPHLVLGDFDSGGPGLADQMEAMAIPVARYPAEKDKTDTHMAVEEAVERGANELILIGCTGDRLDHTIANLLLLPALSSQVQVTVVDAKNVVQVLRPGGRLSVTGSPGDFLSLLPLTPEVKGLVAEGVKWPLDGATLRWGESLGVSNQFAGPEVFLAVREGWLLVVRAWD